MSYGHELEQVWMNIDNVDAVMDRFSNDPSSVQSEVTLHTSPLMIPTGWQGTVNSFLVEQQPTIWIHTRSQADQVLVEIVDIAGSSTSYL